MRKPRRPCDNTLKFSNIFRCDVIKKRVALIKPTSNEADLDLLGYIPFLI